MLERTNTRDTVTVRIENGERKTAKATWIKPTLILGDFISVNIRVIATDLLDTMQLWI